jgi:transposase
MSGTEWAVTEPALPAPAWTLGKGGRPAEYCRRDLVDGIRYLVKEGIQWRAMPADFPHWRTICDYASGWEKTCAAENMHDELRRQCRIAAARDPEPTAAIIDSQSVKAAGTVGKPSRGYDAGKKTSGRKRHIAVDTIGLLLTVLIIAAGVQDRDGARPLPWNLRKTFPSVRLTCADGGSAGKLVSWAKTKLKPRLMLEIVRRPDDLHTFRVLPRRWVVERTLAWITRCRRTVRDYQRLPGPRNHGPLGDDHHHDPAPGPPATSGSIHRHLAPRQAASAPSRPHHLPGSAGAHSASASCGRHRVH